MALLCPTPPRESPGSGLGRDGARGRAPEASLFRHPQRSSSVVFRVAATCADARPLRSADGWRSRAVSVRPPAQCRLALRALARSDRLSTSGARPCRGPVLGSVESSSSFPASLPELSPSRNPPAESTGKVGANHPCRLGEAVGSRADRRRVRQAHADATANASTQRATPPASASRRLFSSDREGLSQPEFLWHCLYLLMHMILGSREPTRNQCPVTYRSSAVASIASAARRRPCPASERGSPLP